jgi:hypothetical protein
MSCIFCISKKFRNTTLNVHVDIPYNVFGEEHTIHKVHLRNIMRMPPKPVDLVSNGLRVEEFKWSDSVRNSGTLQYWLAGMMSKGRHNCQHIATTCRQYRHEKFRAHHRRHIARACCLAVNNEAVHVDRCMTTYVGILSGK